MHSSDFARTSPAIPEITNWFGISMQELALLAVRLVPDSVPKCQVRTGMEKLEIGKIVIGVPPSAIAEQIRLTGESALRMAQMDHPCAVIQAAAYFHLKFEAIHPLTDGNGRIGRYILAQQCFSLHKATALEILDSIFIDNQSCYRAAFLAPIADGERLELLVDMLCRILGVIPRKIPDSRTLNFSLPHTKRAEGGQFRFFPILTAS